MVLDYRISQLLLVSLLNRWSWEVETRICQKAGHGRKGSAVRKPATAFYPNGKQVPPFSDDRLPRGSIKLSTRTSVRTVYSTCASILFAQLVTMLLLLQLVPLLIPIWVLLWHRHRRQLPDGPLGLPFFGNFFDLRGQILHEQLTRWSGKYGDVFSYMIGHRPVVVLSSPESLEELCVKRGNIYSSRPRTSKQADICTRNARIVNMVYDDKWRVGDTLPCLETTSDSDNARNIED